MGSEMCIRDRLWVLEQERFQNGQFDTAFLDSALAERAGRSFSEVTDEEADLAIVGAALWTYLSGVRPSESGSTAVGQTPWQRAARLDGLQR